MLKRSSKRKNLNILISNDVENIIGKKLPNKSTKKLNKNPAAVALGRLGGKKGGKARAEKLTAEQRLQIARKAAYIRWNKKLGNNIE
jgi:hypothetical protein